MGGTEEGEQKCWFRTGDSGREAGEGWVSGAKGCHPPGIAPMVMGNSECWAEGFGYNECCDAKFGPNRQRTVLGRRLQLRQVLLPQGRVVSEVLRGDEVLAWVQ